METIKLSNQHGWRVIELPERVDAFNFLQLKEALESSGSKGESIAVVLDNTKFLSLVSIKLFAEIARELVSKHAQKFAMIGLGEKLKRQIHIYATLENVLVLKSLEECVPVNQEQKKKKNKNNQKVNSPFEKLATT